MTNVSENIHLLSPNQEELWKSHYLSPEQNHLNIFSTWILSDEVNVEAIKGAFQGVLDKYETLRTNYTIRKGRPYQIIQSASILDFEYSDLSQLSLIEFNHVLSNEAHRPFNLERESMMRIRIYQNNINQKILLFNVHHLAIDGWSIMVIMKEFGRLYDALIQGINPPISETKNKYIQFSNEQLKRSQLDIPEVEKKYWIKRLVNGEGISTVKVPVKNSLPHSFKAETLFFSTDENLTENLKEIAKSNNTTLYVLLLTAFKLLLHRYSNQKHVWVATPFSRRNTKILNDVGFFVNTLFIDAEFDQNISFSELLNQVSEKFQGSAKYKDISYAQLTNLMQENSLLGDQNHTNVMFTFQNIRSIVKNNLGAAVLGVGGAKGQFGSLEFEVYQLKKNNTQFEIELEGVEYNNSLHFRLRYDLEKYDSNLIKNMTEHFMNLLEGIIQNDRAEIRSYPLLSESEISDQLYHLNNPIQILDKYEAPNVLDEIEKQVKKNPKAIAVSMGIESLTYEELMKKYNSLAVNLQKLGINQEERIGLAVKPSVDMIAGILGIMKAGAVYIPLDLSYPEERLEYMIDDGDISFILTDAQGNLPCTDEKRLVLHELFDGEGEISGTIEPGQLAYMIYTSGSSGQPKGVMVAHENIYYSTMARNKVYQKELNTLCKFLLLSSISFDSSLVGIFWTLTVGGNVILTNSNEKLDVQELIAVIHKKQVTHLLSVPSFVQLLLDYSDPKQMEYLKCVIVAGEQFPKNLHAYQKEHFPNLALYNEYGPTEGTVWSSWYKLSDQSEQSVVPIGYPTAHAKVYILDSHLNFVPRGTAGEIYIAGQGISRGYNNRPILTAECFIPNPYGVGDRLYKTGDLARYNEDGSIQFLGRIDGQVKINGFRIEVGEIETAIEEDQSVFKSLVFLRREENKNNRLVAYISTTSNHFSLEALKNSLIEKLPYYMIPYHYIVLPEFPLTQNGKVDTLKLQKISVAQTRKKPGGTPRTDLELELINIFREFLGEDIGINDSFFEMGGDSIIAIQISSKAMEKGWKLKPNDIFERKTVANIAVSIEKISHVDFQKVKAEGKAELTPIQNWFFEQKFSYNNHWNQAIRLKIRKDINSNVFKQALEYLIEVHDALRLKFFKNEGKWQQEYTDDANTLSIMNINLTEFNNPENEIMLAVEKLQKTLDISKGPMMTAAYFELSSLVDNEVIIIAHHLVIDMISWNILLKDLEILVDQLLAGEEMKLLPELVSYKEWSDYLSNSPSELDGELTYWQQRNWDYSSEFSQLEKGTEGNRRQIEYVLGKDETRALIQEVPKYYGTKVNEVILAGVALALKNMTSDDNLIIDLESHGRQLVKKELDLSRTVGWFTSIYPIFIEGSNLTLPKGDLLKYIKNSLREVQNHGLGYGMAKWLVREKNIHLPKALFSYNFLGKIDNNFTHSKYLTFHSYLSDSVKDPQEKRLYLIEFEPYIFKEQLCIRVNYSSCFSDVEINNILTEISDNITNLVSLCSHSEEVGFAASDFPEANLDQQTLEKFLAAINSNDR